MTAEVESPVHKQRKYLLPHFVPMGTMNLGGFNEWEPSIGPLSRGDIRWEIRIGSLMGADGKDLNIIIAEGIKPNRARTFHLHTFIGKPIHERKPDKEKEFFEEIEKTFNLKKKVLGRNLDKLLLKTYRDFYRTEIA